MNREKKKPPKLSIAVDLKKANSYHFIPNLSNSFFPYQPYPEQIQIIQTMQQAIKQKQNALIQSPTGTGKTLCLLVGALSGLMNVQKSKNKIFYLTRTHSQISQVISEFNKTVYQCNLNIIASREQFCINLNLKDLKGKYLEKACSDLCAQKLCAYKEFSSNRIPKVQPLTEFKEQCKKQMVCPYFFSKQLTEKCEITIMPFNYLLDWSLFENNYFDLKDAVIIFDQAHNIDKISQEGYNIEISTDVLNLALNELKSLLKSIKKKYLHDKFSTKSQESIMIQEAKTQLHGLLLNLKNSKNKKLCDRNQFIEEFERLTLVTCVFTKQEIDGIDLGNYQEFCSKSKKIIKFFYKKELSFQNFQKISITIEKMFQISSSNEEFSKYSASLIIENNSILRFRCLDPSLSFSKILYEKPRSIFLSSGTLGPLDKWQENLKFPIKHKLTINSFIVKQQLFAQIKKKSSAGFEYDFSFQKRKNQKLYVQLASDLRRIEQIVDGGIVVAFSNYDLMERALKYCSSLKKKVFYESKGAKIQEIFHRYEDSISKEGAFLFIIMKGRFSEGINFNDHLCRCLIIVGIPYLPFKDPNIIQKMDYIQQKQTKNSADEWYIKQSFKCLNQTIGRVIRNKNDFGSILLFDQRYSRKDVINEFSSWFRVCIREEENCSNFDDISQFYKEEKWLNRKEEKHDTKNKKQPNIQERLEQFSTPSKTDKRKLKLVFEKCSPSYKRTSGTKSFLQEISLTKFDEPEIEQPSYQKMKKNLSNFFLADCNQETSTNPSNNYEEDEMPEKIRKPQKYATSYKKKRINEDLGIDF